MESRNPSGKTHEMKNPRVRPEEFESFIKNPEKYADKIIKYEESPDKKAYIGINKLPLQKAAGGGHGYQGVLIQSVDRNFIQCHACGKWLKKVSSRHLTMCCGLTARQYKKKYGLYLSLGLVSDTTSMKLTRNVLKKYSGQTQYNAKFHIPPKRSSYLSTQYLNLHGTCPAQLRARLLEFIRCNKEIPAPGNRGRNIYKALTNRYGKMGNALMAHGLHYFERKGTNYKYTFPDGFRYKFNLNKMYDRNRLFDLMMKKCPVLSEGIMKDPVS